LKIKLFVILSLFATLICGSLAITEDYLISDFLGIREYRNWFSIYRLPETISTASLLLCLFVGNLNLTFKNKINLKKNSISLSLILLIFLQIRSIPSYFDSQLLIPAIQSTFTLSILPLSYIFFASNYSFQNANSFQFKSINFISNLLLSISIIKLFVSIYINRIVFDSSLLDRIVSRNSLYPAAISLSIMIALLFPFEKLSKKENFIDNKLIILITFLFGIILIGGSRGLFLAYVLSLMVLLIIYCIKFSTKFSLRIFLKKNIYILLFTSLILLTYNFSSIYEGFISFFIRPQEGLDLTETYRFRQLSCLLSSIFQNPIFGAGPGNSPSCWDLYAEGVTRQNQLELEFFNMVFQYGLLYYLYSFYCLFLVINFLSNSLSYRYQKILTFFPASIISIAFFNSFTNGSLLSIYTQVILSFGCLIAFTPLNK